MTPAGSSAPGVLGVRREPMFSPGKEEADVAILRLTFEWLAARGVEARSIAADALKGWKEAPGLVLSMAQGEEALEHLARWEAEGVPVLNATQSVRTASRREALFSRLRESPFEGFRVPRTVVVHTGGGAGVAEAERTLGGWGFPLWVKRGDFHALGAGDVLKVNAPEGVGEALSALAARGISRAVCQEHVEGEVVKFYGVGGERLWYWRSRAERRHLPYADSLSALSHDASRRVGLDIYGGDAIITARGELFLIDLNDWPSFTGCQADASDAIADLACERLKSSAGRG